MIGATNPLEAATGLDPRRLRDRGRPEHGPRLGLAGVRPARGRTVLPRALNRGHPLRPTPIIRREAPSSWRRVAAAARDPRAGRHLLHRPRLGRRGGDPRRPRRGRRGERAPQGAGGPPRAAGSTLGADTLVAVDGDILGKPRDAAQAREYVARLAGRTHQVVGGIASSATASSPTPRSRSPRSTSARRAPPRSTGTSRPASGRAAPAATPSRAPAPRSSRASRATTSTSSACRSACSTCCRRWAVRRSGSRATLQAKRARWASLCRVRRSGGLAQTRKRFRAWLTEPRDEREGAFAAHFGATALR